MKNLDSLPYMPSIHRRRLQTLGIHSVDHLYERLTMPKLCNILALQLGVSIEVLAAWKQAIERSASRAGETYHLSSFVSWLFRQLIVLVRTLLAVMIWFWLLVKLLEPGVPLLQLI